MPDPPLKLLLLRGSAFQLKVWEALLAIPSGEFSRYRWGCERKQAMIAREAGTAGVEV